ncbi:MAG TPA: DUF72 domain-containing protein [Thermodesulfovibrionales bacterium]|nr:DUF72 domain-containing protein [Thermodesulfovibrionales bacterium]
MISYGSCSWTEKSLIKSREFYPKGVNTAEERLRYYASAFGVVEVDSSYYAIPSVEMVSSWAERTPPGFLFHIKAYSLLTGHGADLKAIPSEVRDMLSADSLKKDRITIRDKKALQIAFGVFKEAFGPLAEAHKAGIVVFQYPPYFAYEPRNLEYILFCKDMMEGFLVGVEFRHGSWLTPERRDRIFSFLRENGITYITADEPQYGNLSTVPFIPYVTTDIAYFRLHGRNKENWLKKGIETSLRYDYLYSAEELEGFVTHLFSIDNVAAKTFVMFNNCHLGYSMKNALRLREMMKGNKYLGDERG